MQSVVKAEIPNTMEKKKMLHSNENETQDYFAQGKRATLQHGERVRYRYLHKLCTGNGKMQNIKGGNCQREKKERFWEKHS